MSVGTKLFSFLSKDTNEPPDTRDLEGSGSFWRQKGYKVPGHAQPDVVCTSPPHKVYGAQHPPKYVADSDTKVSQTDHLVAYHRSMVTDIEEGFNIPLTRSHSDGVTRPPDATSPLSDPPGLKFEFDIKAHFLNKVKHMSQSKAEEQRSAFRGSEGLGYDPNDRETAKLEKFGKSLAGPNTDINVIRKLSWGGIPAQLRGTTWQLLCGYLPTNIDRRESTLTRKRLEYRQYLDSYYKKNVFDNNHDIMKQIQVDVPRMNSEIKLFRQQVVREVFIRVLFIWSIRHPASGYVQGINDLLTPFFIVFLSSYVPADKNTDTIEFSSLPQCHQDTIEADSYWCVNHFLEGIQDNYTFEQPGIQLKVAKLREIVQRVDNNLHQHLIDNEIEYMAFSFRWMNNLLMREFPLHCIIRLWDTYLSEREGFAEFHLYTCAAFLLTFSKQLIAKPDLQALILFLQRLPTDQWGDRDMELLLAEAYRLKYTFENAHGHLKVAQSKDST
ncbi:TBC1 domain family member 22B [Oopsacas minuta]|uniref:TBC1 domain family member 22B n=1 Tax=Oopsacas minuta TaxID=111878 RepID=A0AAV7K7V9_9METZ|nr:TBC1 domain family member 22B [Oopsacas minuta]KAI6656306.1 TBC1 domain family member 22B [Oopsacas minuta]